jgi:monoamine oxidase
MLEADVDVAIVGAGASGLAAARRLKDAGRSFVVLEARDRVGGRLKRGTLAGLDIDLGGMWMGPSQRRLAALTQSFGMRRYPTYLEGRNAVTIARRTARGEGERADGVFDVWSGLDYTRLMSRLNALRASPNWGDAGIEDSFKKLDALSVAAWLDRHAKTSAARSAVAFQVRALLCAEPEDVSLAFFLFYLASGEGAGVLLSAGPGGAQNFAFVGGLAQLVEHLSKDLTPAVRLSTPVRAIAQGEEGVLVTADGGVVRCARCIVAVPPTLAGRIDFAPHLAHAREALHQRMAMGSVIKVWLAYETPFWRANGSNGFVMSDAAPFSPCFDVSPPDQPLGVLVGFFDAAHARFWGDRNTTERRAAALDVITGALGPAARNPLDYVEQDWTAESWSRGCYGGFASPGLMTACGDALRAPFGRVHWAGTETAAQWCGYVEGALAAGERAADEVHAALA